MSGEQRSAFDHALTNFIQDFANGGAIRHLADQGYTVTEIAARLSFPAPGSSVAATVWKHYLETGKIRLEPPDETGVLRRVTYVKEQNAYGRISMRQVTEEVQPACSRYLRCDFGKQLYQDREGFLEKLAVLDARDRQYILDLPWPLAPVYHQADERMLRIFRRLEDT